MRLKTEIKALSKPLIDEEMEEILPPSEFCLFHFGETLTSKGTVYLDRETAELCITCWKEQGNDLSLDYEHQAIKPNNGPIPAAGWFKLEIKDDGLYAVGVEWTPRATELLSQREYRYYSPAFYTDEDSKVIEIINCALTNIPAIKGLKPLVASKLELLQGVEDMTLEEMKLLLDEYFAKVPEMVQSAFEKYLQEMSAVEKPVEEVEVAEVEVAEVEEVVVEEAEDESVMKKCGKDLEKEKIEALSSKVLDLEEQTLEAALIALGGDTANVKRFNDLKVLSKMHRVEGQSILDSVKAFAKENADLFTAPKAPSKVFDRKALNVLSKPIETVVKLNKFENWKKATSSKNKSKFIGGK